MGIEHNKVTSVVKLKIWEPILPSSRVCSHTMQNPIQEILIKISNEIKHGTYLFSIFIIPKEMIGFTYLHIIQIE